MDEKEKIGVKLKRLFGVFFISLVDVLIFVILLVTNSLDSINIQSFVSSFIEIIGVLLGLTFTSYAIILGVMKSLKPQIRRAKGFGVIGTILFFTAISEIIDLASGVIMVSLKNITPSETYALESIFIQFSI